MAKGGAKKINMVESLAGEPLVGTDGRDVFILREGGGQLQVEGFNPANDKIMFDISSYSDVLGPLGHLHDGQTFDDFTGGTHFTVSALDYNLDGLMDTQIQANEDSIIILGVAPDSLSSGNLMGG